MLTVQQADILDLLNKFKCLRYSHVSSYISAKHCSSDEHFSKMVNQLRFLGKVRLIDDLVMLPGRKVNQDILTAFDVVMDLTQGYVENLFTGAYPFTLKFTAKTKAESEDFNFFGIVIVDRHMENNIRMSLETVSSDLTVIFVLRDLEQQKYLKTHSKSYFAIQENNGKYKFFKAEF